jgi:type IX secretion system PorP/SprF family membrane protein
MKKLFIFLVFIAQASICIAQDPHFSQFYAAPLYLGPSMAGSGEYPRLVLNFRDQWPKLKGRFVTYSLSYDKFIEKYKSGFGFIFLRDNAGSGKLITTQAGLNYSYRIPITQNFNIQPGIQFQYFQRKINFNELTFADQYYGDQILPSSVETAPDKQGGHMDFSSSIIGFGKSFWIGFTVDHLMKLNHGLKTDDRYVPLKFTSFGGVNFYLRQSLLKKDEKIISLAYQYRNQLSVQQLDLGIYYHQLPFVIGLWYRGVPVVNSAQTRDALTLAGGIEVKQFMFTYSYDMTISSLISSTGGAHEIATIFYFDTNKTGRKRRLAPVTCPVF